MSNQNQFNTNE